MLAELQAGLSVSIELEARAEQHGVFADECQPLTFEHVVRAFLTVAFYQFRFVVKQIQLRRRANKVNINHMLCARSEMGLPRSGFAV